MAEEKVKVIHSSVRIDENKDRGDGRVSHASKLYGPGDEKALAKELSKEQLQKLSEDGSISGFGYDPKEGEAPASAPAAPEGAV